MSTRSIHTSEPRASQFACTCCALILGIAITLVLRGYQFGKSNHTVYLIDALRMNDPSLLANDWFTTHTLQYHFVFTRVTAWLDRVGILRPAYLIGYLLLVLLLHIAWWLIVRTLGGSRRTYLLSVAIFFLSAGGISLGMYDYLQDSSFLPSNVANIAMLWAIYFWISGRRHLAGAALGVAGFFHLNHALVAIGLWCALIAWNALRPKREASESNAGPARSQTTSPQYDILVGTLVLLALCLPNILPVARASLKVTHKLPLREFVDLYVHLRHPHHYDPSSWPVALWLSFLWPFPLALLAASRAVQSPKLQQTTRIFLLFCGLLIVAILFAGIWYISEPLVQMSLFRFSIYPKLLSCIGAAAFIESLVRRRRLLPMSILWSISLAALVFALTSTTPALHANVAPAALLLGVMSFILIYQKIEDAPGAPSLCAGLLIPLTLLALVISWRHDLLGLRIPAYNADPPDYVAVCRFARDHTPTDAIFLVPPNEQEFRLIARRAIVINFKGVPQFSGELGEWSQRLATILDLPDLYTLPRRFDRTMDAIGRRYAELPADRLWHAAREFDARYIVTTRPLTFPAPAKLIFESGTYHLYDLIP